ncbi:MAG: 4Fe-4S binding protein [Deltaproteobacteria bacterium]|nr:4Fe-4S binding protein [Deltaproteobacteria bacterium]
MSYTITESCDGCGACVWICPVGAVRGEKKTPHAIVGDLCIECGACGRICPREALLDAERKVRTRIPKLSLWPRPVIDLKRCLSCGICVEGCPARCLASDVDPGDKHLRASLSEPKKCISCGFCVEECPAEAIVLAVPATPAEVSA